MAVMSGISGIPDMARVWSCATPEKVALIDTDRVVTYAELEDRSNRIANRLVAADIRPGSHVGYLGKNSAAFFEVGVVGDMRCAAATPTVMET